MKQRTILIATTNRGKLREIQAVAAGLPVTWQSLADHPGLPEVVEDGATFEANAAKKALQYAALTGLWTLADDSGLEVDALDGEPGVHSARYSGTGDDLANNRKLVAALRDVPMPQRTARFVCHLALAADGRILATAPGVIEGHIIDAPRGTNGFGYDPHFLLIERGVTTAELPPEEKNRISHRGQALRKLLAELPALLAAHPAGAS
jgi:XTP/dITP diphosphohydrolase